MQKPTLMQIVVIRDMLALGDTLDNLTYQGNDISYVQNGKLHKITSQGEVYVSQWEYVTDRRRLAMWRDEN